MDQLEMDLEHASPYDYTYSTVTIPLVYVAYKVIAFGNTLPSFATAWRFAHWLWHKNLQG